ncbi:winged helix-turn-helix transcriptional regulator [Streptomyces sp. NBC_01217]|uniref:winged helix-turn-helix transcriptional regulator n=1 Tax=Streptomyces sp. NBC_01217 TaxID=2903779 RepID=UPI002E10AB9A|nr:response regulator transcription factor [Streptomyces sp. NBC_01217]
MTPDAHRLPETATQGSSGGPEDGKAPGLLLAEPDMRLADETVSRFAAAGVTAVVCHDGAEALLQVGARRPRAVLLGAPLPVVGAAAVTELIARLHPVPVIVGAGTDGSQEATAALAVGAVAVVARPYRTEEILPLLLGTRPSGDGSVQTLVIGDIELDAAGFHVYVRGRALQLPVREFMLLRYLMEHANRVVSRSELTQAIWGVESLDSNSLTVHIRRVRNRLREDSGSCCTIDAIRGMGYRLDCGTKRRQSASSGLSAPGSAT